MEFLILLRQHCHSCVYVFNKFSTMDGALVILHRVHLFIIVSILTGPSLTEFLKQLYFSVIFVFPNLQTLHNHLMDMIWNSSLSKKGFHRFNALIIKLAMAAIYTFCVLV